MENTALYDSARAQATVLLPQLESYNLTHSRGKGTVSGNNTMHIMNYELIYQLDAIFIV